MRYQATTVIVLAAVLTAGCSSKPRAFAPQLAAAPADEIAYQHSLARCRESAGMTGGKSTGTKIASGAGAAAVGGATAGGASWGAAAAASAASIVALPVLGLVWGLSRGDRSRKERRIKQSTAECLQGEGYTVAGWTRIKRADAAQTARAEASQPEKSETSQLPAEGLALAEQQ